MTAGKNAFSSFQFWRNKGSFLGGWGIRCDLATKAKIRVSQNSKWPWILGGGRLKAAWGTHSTVWKNCEVTAQAAFQSWGESRRGVASGTEALEDLKPYTHHSLRTY